MSIKPIGNRYFTGIVPFEGENKISKIGFLYCYRILKSDSEFVDNVSDNSEINKY